MPDKEELLEQPAKMNEIKEKEEDMSELFKLKPCEECNGTGIALIEKHDCDCPDCLGTGYEEPAKRIMNLELMLNQLKQALKSSGIYINDLAQNLEIAWEQRDRLAEALRKAVQWADCASIHMENRHEINWTHLNEAKEALAAVEGGSHE